MKQYPAFKSKIGNQWFGQVPSDWEIMALKHVTKYVKTGGTPLTKEAKYYDNGEIDWYTPEDISTLILKDAKKKISKLALEDGEVRLFTKDSLLLVGIGATIGKVGILTKDATSNQQINAICFNKKLNPKFGLYYFYSIAKIINDFSSTSTMGIFNQTKTKAIYLPVPKEREQIQIVKYLDFKIDLIDGFIANRQKQIDLLKEQLHFKINQAITKGINADVKFKSTDIKYVPEIPEHWDIRKFKSLTSILTCGYASTPEYVDESVGIPFLSAQNCRPFRMDLSKYSYIKKSLHKQLTRYKKPQKGDVLVTRVGAGIGQACVIDTDLEFSVYVSLTHIRPNKEILSEYIVYFFNTEYCYQLNHEGTVVGGGQGNLNVKNVERYRIPLPEIDEQKEIIAYLNKFRRETDTLISKYQKQIDLMQEYRTAIISQAVTGKIDVRDWKPKEKKSLV